MDVARADALTARSRLAEGRHWIARNAETFRHLPPPAAAVWLGEPGEDTPGDGSDALLADAGWTLHPVGQSVIGPVEAHWLDAADPGQRAELFAGLPQPGDDEAAPFAWAHRALCRQGLRLRIGGAPGSDAARGGPQTVWLQLRRQPRAAVEAPLLVVELRPGVRCVLIESHEREAGSGERAVVQNLQVHVQLGEGASLQHLRIAMPGPNDRVAHHVQARLDADAVYAQALVATGSAYHLQRSVLELAGARASARAAGVLLAHGTALEQQVRTQHLAGGTHSVVETLALARDAAQVVVNAHTGIAPGAADAAARQRLNGIPTGGRPRIVLRPHLEIDHDQVQAAHGATWGALPEDALFYAAQRGLSERAARALIVEGMARAVLARGLDEPGLIETPEVAALLVRTVAEHLGEDTEASHG